MNKQIQYDNVFPVALSQTTIGITVPIEWCSHNRLETGQSVYCSGLLNGEIEYHTDARQWAKEIKLMLAAGRYPRLSIPAELARTRGITRDTELEAREDPASGSLILRRVE